MPQPFNSIPVAKRGLVLIGNAQDSPSDHNPQLALLAMTVVARWSILEGFVRTLLLAITDGSTPPEEAAAFAGIHSQTQQAKALRAAADRHIHKPEVKDLIYAVLDVYGQASKTRNRIAHWLWGFCSEIPDGLLLRNPVTSLEQTAQGDGSYANIRGVWIYKARDFQEAIDKIATTIKLVGEVRMLISLARWDKPLVARELHRLQNEPQLRRALDRLNRDRQSAPGGCLPPPDKQR